MTRKHQEETRDSLGKTLNEVQSISFCFTGGEVLFYAMRNGLRVVMLLLVTWQPLTRPKDAAESEMLQNFSCRKIQNLWEVPFQ